MCFLYFSKNIHHNLGKGTLASDTRTVPYYEEVINGNHFFFLASESVKGGDLADLSDTQLEWLDNKLWHIAQKKSPEPVFIFCHGALANTVAGSYSYQYTIENGIKKTWNGVLQDSKLRFILNKYPNVFYFSGHSHWNLSSANTMYQDKATYGGGIGATLFNGGSVTNLWSDNGGIAGGSQGLHVKVYEDKVVVKGRDYANKKWISDAVFTINLKDKYDSLNKIYYQSPKE